jgi:multiple sugar transport system permease protein
MVILVNSKGTKNTVGLFIKHILLIVIALVVMVPFLFMLTTSFKAQTEITVAGFTWFPHQWLFSNYIKAFQDGDWARYFVNTFFVTFVVVIGSVFFNSMAGFSFARLNFVGKNVIFIAILAGIMIPQQSVIIPQYIIMKSIPFAGGNNLFGVGGHGWLNTYLALIIPFLSGAFGIFLCRQFYLTFPKALDEAARIDGCSAFTMFIQVYLPNSKAIIATLVILKSVATWNDFFNPLIMTNSEEMMTVQLALQQFKGMSGVQWNYLMAATVISMLPVLILFFACQKYFVQGIVSTGMKN